MSNLRLPPWSRREFLATASGAVTAGLVDLIPNRAAAEPPPETATLRITRTSGICVGAPLYVAEELLPAEGFTDLRHVTAMGRIADELASDRVDIGVDFVGPLAIRLDVGAPLLVLAGVHTGCHEVFAKSGVDSLADLRGRTVAIPALGSGEHIFLSTMLAYARVDPRQVMWVARPSAEAMRLLSAGEVDAVPTFPPTAYEFRRRKAGRTLVNTSTDLPWSRHFCCMVAATRDFVQRHPIAAKRALRAILKGADVCAQDPERVASGLVGRGVTAEQDDIVQILKENAYAKWRELDPEETVRFHALHLRGAGMITSLPESILARGTDWRLLRELKNELKG
jgi:NitT/TauT family transport system substrate-binding protein